jgi:tagaturonate reductase
MMRPAATLPPEDHRVDDQMDTLPETVLQFGGGNLLRAFADAFVDAANRDGQRVGRVVVVQSTRSGVAEQINRQEGRYHVVVRGLRDGHPIDAVEPIASVSRALDAATQWVDVRAVAASAALAYVVSNTTEAGLALDPADDARPTDGTAPRSFPAKLLDLLWHRFDAGHRGALAICPCELLPKNGELLRSLAATQAQRWGAPPAVRDWVDGGCAWVNSLVDRIVSGRPAEHPLLATDALLTVAEPFALWAVRADDRVPLFRHPAIERVADTAPYELRKLRILNGAHTALVARAMPMGIPTVREAVSHPTVGPWLRRLLDGEIVPTIEGRAPAAAAFAAATLERFANPYLEHRLASIALHHDAKVRARLLPTRDEFVARFGRRPPLLDEVIG